MTIDPRPLVVVFDEAATVDPTALAGLIRRGRVTGVHLAEPFQTPGNPPPALFLEPATPKTSPEEGNQ